MKLVRRFSTVWACALAMVAAAVISADAAPIKNKAIVRRVEGTADISTNGGQSWTKAKVGQTLKENSVVRTAPGSTVDLFLGDNGPVVRVTPDTRMGIDKLDLDNTGLEKVIETQLDLKNGRILGNVKKMAAASKYEVETPAGVAGIRGTEYSISANGNLSVVSGTVVIVYIVNGVPQPPVVVGAGQSVTPPVGNQPAQVTQLTAQTVQALGAEVAVLVVGIETLPNGETRDTVTGTTTGANGNEGGGGGGEGGGNPPPGGQTPGDQPPQGNDTTTRVDITAT